MYLSKSEIDLIKLERNLNSLCEKKITDLAYVNQRVDYIKKWLEYNKIPFSISNIISQPDKIYYNINICFYAPKADSKDTLLFLAHHDIVNKKSDNVNDNSASVINLLYLAQILYNKYVQDKNIIIVLNDDEERVNKVGCSHLMDSIINKTKPFHKVNPSRLKIITLDVTALGDCLLIENTGSEFQKSVSNTTFIGTPVITELPPNDALFIRNKYKLDAVCLSLLPECDLKNPRNIWSTLHTTKDVNYNVRHMANLIYYLNFLSNRIKF